MRHRAAWRRPTSCRPVSATRAGRWVRAAGRQRGTGAGGRQRRTGGAEVDPGRLGDLAPHGRLDLEQLLLPEPEPAGDEARREGLDTAVVVLHVGVVEAAGGLEPVLRVLELALQLQEALVGLQVRVAL